MLLLSFVWIERWATGTRLDSIQFDSIRFTIDPRMPRLSQQTIDMGMRSVEPTAAGNLLLLSVHCFCCSGFSLWLFLAIINQWPRKPMCAIADQIRSKIPNLIRDNALLLYRVGLR